MNLKSSILGFLPMVLFAGLGMFLDVTVAAAVGCAAAVVVAAINPRGSRTIPVATVVILAVIALVGLVASGPVATFIATYGQGLLPLALAAYILATAGRRPFTEAAAAATVSDRIAHSVRFHAVNVRISTAWGLATLAIGVAHLLSLWLGRDTSPLGLRLLLDYGIPLIAVVGAARYTRRTVAAARALGARLQEATAGRPAAEPTGSTS